MSTLYGGGYWRRRAAIMSKSGGGVNGYIPDGLVFYLDAIDNGNESGVWIEKINSLQFDLQGSSFASNALVKTVQAGPYYASNPMFPHNECTIEAAFQPNQGERDGAILRNSDSSCIQLWNHNGHLYYKKITHDLYYVPNADVVQTLSVNDNLCLQNGNLMSKDGRDNWGTSGDGVRIGSNGEQFCPFYGKIYTIRIYNRLLSQNEMLQNQRNDNIRFNLGLTI